MNYHDIFVKKSIDASTLSNLEKYMFFHLPTTTTKHVEYAEPVTEELHLETHNSFPHSSGIASSIGSVAKRASGPASSAKIRIVKVQRRMMERVPRVLLNR